MVIATSYKTMIGDSAIKRIDTELQDDLKKELRDQGHYLTGALERSFTSNQSTTSSKSVIEIKALDYAEDLFEGIRPEHIDPNDPAYIKGLTRYAEKRFGKTGKAAIKAAVAIARKHSEEGMPTQNSYQYSNTGERLFANVEAYNKNEDIYGQLLETGASAEIDAFIDKTFDQTIF
jgi:hypothetical protein